MFLGIVALAAPLFHGGTAVAQDSTGSRYALERYYHSEVSSARAHLDTRRPIGHGTKAILVDVRRVREYTAGHPNQAYNIPYPSIYQGGKLEGYPDNIGQDMQVFYDAVLALATRKGGDLDTPIYTLCRTGFRSMLAGNILADPERYGVVGDGFTNVRNIWEGFVGRHKEASHGSGGEHLLLDLNNDGVVTMSDASDVYDHTPDANPDKDGWGNYQQLPWTSELNGWQLYWPNIDLYEEFSGQSVKFGHNHGGGHGDGHDY